MKKMLGFFSAVAVLTAILWGCQCASEPVEGIVDIPPAPPPPIAKLYPGKADGHIGLRLGDMLPDRHISQMRFDDEISRRAWTNLVTFYDFDHSVFLKSDLERLARRDTRLDD